MLGMVGTADGAEVIDMIWIGNAFSLNMLSLADCKNQTLHVTPVTPVTVVSATRNSAWQSCVGHADTAAVVSGQLGICVTSNRASVTLAAGDVLFVAQYSGSRLPEGATTLPEGATIRWFQVDVS